MAEILSQKEMDELFDIADAMDDEEETEGFLSQEELDALIEVAEQKDEEPKTAYSLTIQLPPMTEDDFKSTLLELVLKYQAYVKVI